MPDYDRGTSGFPFQTFWNKKVSSYRHIVLVLKRNALDGNFVALVKVIRSAREVCRLGDYCYAHGHAERNPGQGFWRSYASRVRFHNTHTLPQSKEAFSRDAAVTV